MSALAESVLLFVRALRNAGIGIPADGAIESLRALDLVGVRRRVDVREALRAILISRHDDSDTFDRLFAAFWRPDGSSSSGGPRPMQVPPRVTTNVQWLAAPDLSSSGPDRALERDIETTVSTFSDAEVFRQKDFADYDDADVARARVALNRLAWTPGERVTRRWRRGDGSRVDMRRLLRTTLSAGEVFAIPKRERRVEPRPLVLICDVSGSMEPYVRMLLLFVYGLARRQRRLEVFVFSTRLTRVTRQFVGRPIDDALARAHDAARDWSGGTRIGAALRTFNMEWGRRVLRRGPVVMVISDGWDLGDPEVLRDQMARLKRSCSRLVWLNPLIGSPGYEPLTRGMRAALPYADDFLSVRNLASLDALVAALDMLPDRRGGVTRTTSWN